MKFNLPSTADKILSDLISGINSIQPELIEGAYVTGSLALGDYYSKKSDVDFLVLLSENPSTRIINQLEQIHKDIEKKYNNPKVNGYYLTLKGLKEQQQNFPSFFMGKMNSSRPFELDKFSIMELKTSSITLIGKPASELPIEVTMEEVLVQLHQNINSYWLTWTKKHSGFNHCGLSLIFVPRLTEWGILGVARQLYTLRTGKITSKLNAGYYILENFPEEYHEIIRTAIDVRNKNKTHIMPSIKRRNKTIECMRFVIDEFNRTYIGHKITFS